MCTLKPSNNIALYNMPICFQLAKGSFVKKNDWIVSRKKRIFLCKIQRVRHFFELKELRNEYIRKMETSNSFCNSLIFAVFLWFGYKKLPR